MSPETLRLVERIHGHIGWLAAAALIHPAILLRNPRRRAPLSAILATTLATLTGVLGATIYPDYSRLLRRAIYLTAPRFGVLFERKEHLAFAAVSLAWAGCLLHLTVRDGAHDDASLPRARAAHLAYVAAAVLTTVVATLGTWIAAHRSF